jgi:hypothetical protein
MKAQGKRSDMFHSLVCRKSALCAAFVLAMHTPAFSDATGGAHGSKASLAAARSDRLVIRLINADTGEPMSHQNVLVEWDADAEESIVYVGGKGRGTMPILESSENFTLKPGVKDYGDPDRLAYFSCSGPTIAVPVAQAIHKGFIAHNECNNRTVQVNPGEIVFWARPLPLWKPDFQ